MRNKIFLVLIFSAIAGCAGVPKESVELSATLGRDLNEIHRAHKELAVRYFKRMKGDINDFVDNIYRPYMIKSSIRDFKLIEKIQNAESMDGGADALTIMEIYVNLVTNQIETFRKELLKEIIEKEAKFLADIDDAYQKLQNANAIVTGHLASIRKVHDTQAELLERAGLQNLRKKFIEETVNVSDRVAALVAEARKTEKNLDVEKIAKDIQSVISSLKTK